MNRAALKLGLGSFPAITVALHLKNLRSCSVDWSNSADRGELVVKTAGRRNREVAGSNALQAHRASTGAWL